MNTINQKTSFGSVIRVSKLAYAKSAFKKLNLSTNYIGEPWTIYQSRYLREAFSDEASFCTMGVIKNSCGNGFVFHLKPQSSSYTEMFENFKRATENLTIRNEKPTGFLIGGIADNILSKRQYEIIQSMFKELNIKYSAFLGQQANFFNLPYSNMHYNGHQDKYIIAPFSDTTHKKIKLKMNNLKDFYDTIIIRKGDSIKFD